MPAAANPLALLAQACERAGVEPAFVAGMRTITTDYTHPRPPIQDERLQRARMAAQIGIEAIAAGDVPAARAFLADALGFLKQISEAG